MSQSARAPKMLSSGIVPVYLRPGPDPLYLLLRVYNHWDFPKGGVDPNEDPFDTALRELKEETTLQEVEFPWGKDYRETAPYSHGKVARYYVAKVPTTDVNLPLNPALGFAEHHEYRWVSRQEASRLLGDRVREVLLWADSKMRSVASAQSRSEPWANP